MVDRLYILLDIVDGKAAEATEALQANPGVLMADAVEGPPDVIIVMEASRRQHLAKLTVQALASVETLTENVRLLPTRQELESSAPSKLTRRSRTGSKGGGRLPRYGAN